MEGGNVPPLPPLPRSRFAVSSLAPKLSWSQPLHPALCRARLHPPSTRAHRRVARWHGGERERGNRKGYASWSTVRDGGSSTAHDVMGEHVLLSAGCRRASRVWAFMFAARRGDGEAGVGSRLVGLCVGRCSKARYVAGCNCEFWRSLMSNITGMLCNPVLNKKRVSSHTKHAHPSLSEAGTFDGSLLVKRLAGWIARFRSPLSRLLIRA